MPRNIEVLLAQAMERARAASNLPPLVLPIAFRGALPFESGTGGWPRELFMPDGMGFGTMRPLYGVGQPANDGPATVAESAQQ